MPISIYFAACLSCLSCSDAKPAQPEATFQDKPASHWIRLLDDIETTGEAGWALRAGKRQSIPVLVEVLESGGFFSTKTATEILKELGAGAVPDLVALLKDPQSATRCRACRALTVLGPEARTAVPQLIRNLKDDDEKVREAALIALGEIGPQARMAVPVLLQALPDETLPRPLLILALGAIGPPARAAVPFLIGYLDDDDKKTRCAAVLALGTIGRDARRALPQLLAAAKSKDPEVRKCAFEALGGIGPDAESAIPLLIASLKGPSHDDETRSTAEQALGRIGEPAVPALIELLPIENQNVHWRAVTALGHSGRVAVLPLINALGDQRQQVRLGAVMALGEIGTEAEEAISALLVQYRRKNTSEDLGFRQSILQTLGKIGPKDDRVVSTLVGALSDKGLRHRAVDALLEIPEAASTAVPAVFAALRGMDDTFFFRSPADLLAKIGRPALPYLVQGLRDPESKVRINSAQALGEMGAYAIPAVRRALRDEAEEVRLASIKALLKMSGENRHYLMPVLSGAASDSSAKVRAAVAECLGHMDRDAAEAVVLLGTALHDASPEVRQKAAQALQAFIKESAAATRMLVAALADEDDAVCAAAAKSLNGSGPRANSAVPALIRLVEDERKERKNCRDEAIDALKSLGPEARAAVPALVKAYESGQDSAGAALGQIGPDARAAVPALGKAVRKRAESPLHSDARFTAAVALAKIGQETKLALPVLIRMLKENWVRRKDAAEALGCLGPEAKDAVPVLLEIMKRESGRERLQVIVTLGQIGPAAEAAVPELWKELRAEDWMLQKDDVVLALARIEAGPQADLQALVKALRDDDVYVRRYAVNTLDLLGSACKPALPALLDAINDKDPIVRFKAAKALGHLGPEARPAAAALAGLLRKQEVFPVHFSAAYALVQIGEPERGGKKLVEVLRAGSKINNMPAFHISTPNSMQLFAASDNPVIRLYAAGCLVKLADIKPKDAVPILSAGLRERDAAARAFGLEALGNLGNDARPAVQDVLEALMDRDTRVRHEAAQALKKIDPDAAAKAGVR